MLCGFFLFVHERGGTICIVRYNTRRAKTGSVVTLPPSLLDSHSTYPQHVLHYCCAIFQLLILQSA